MILIDVEGGTKSMRLLTEHATFMTLQRLLPRKRTLNIDIEIKNTLKEGNWGTAYNATTDRQQFHWMELHNKPPSLYNHIQTLCHEAVHISQAVKKHWHHRGSRSLWKGVDHTHTPYRQQPWEVEAFKLEKTLAKMYLKDIGLTIKRAKELDVRQFKLDKHLGLDWWELRV